MSETTIGALAVRIGADASQLISELNKADKALKAKEVTFKNATKAAVAYGAAIGAAGVAVYAFVKHVSNAADELGKLSQKVGVSVESLSALKHAAAVSDVTMESFAQGLKILSRNMTEAHAGTGEAQEAFRALGVTLSDSSGKVKLTEEVLLTLADKFEEMEDGAGKTALAMKIFGKSGSDLIPLLNQGRKGIEELKKEAAALGIVISKDAAEAAEKFNDNVTRLKGATEGLTIQLAGPLIKAFGDATEAMIKAHKEGQGFLGMLTSGWQMLAMGKDYQEWARRFTNTTDEYLIALNKMDKIRAGRRVEELSASERAMYERAKLDAETTKKQLDTMRAIQPIIAPEHDKPEGGGDGGGGKKKKKAAPVLNEDTLAEQARVAQQIEEGEEEFRKTSTEAWEIYHQYLRSVFSDTTHEIAESAEFGVEYIKEVTRSAADKEKEAADARLKVWFDYIDRKQEAEEDAMREEAAAKDEHERQLDAMGHKHRQFNLAAAKTFFGHMSQLMNTNSKKMFEIGKAAAIAETVINTHAAAMGAYKALSHIPYVGPALGAAAAAAVMASGAAQISAIRAQQVGGGSSATGAFAANPQTGQPVGTPGGDVGGDRQRGPDTIINLPGADVVSTESVRRLLERVSENVRDGGRIVIA